MARSTKSIGVAVLLWLIIFAGIAITVRYLIFPLVEEQKDAVLAKLTGSTPSIQHQVKLALDSFSGYCILRSPELSRRLENRGIKITPVDDGADYRQRIRSLRTGSVQMAVFPINSFIQNGVELGSFPGTIVYIIDETQGADAILSNDAQISTIQDLNRKDARIVLTPGSPSEFLARVMLASFELPALPRDFIIEAQGSAEVLARYQKDGKHQPWAYVMWEPDVSRAKHLSGTKVLLDSSKVQGYIVDVLVVQREFLLEHEDLVRQVVESTIEAASYYRMRMPECIIEDSKLIGETITRKDAEQITKGVQWKNLLENYAHFGLLKNSHSIESLSQSIAKIVDVLVQTGVLTDAGQVGPLSSLYYDQILKDIQKDRNLANKDASEEVRDMHPPQALSESAWKSLKPVGVLRIAPILFGRGTARLNVKSEQDLQSLARTLNSWPHYYLKVTGRTRPSENQQAAEALAKARAEAAVDKLVEFGVARERLRTQFELASRDDVSGQSVLFIVGEP